MATNFPNSPSNGDTHVFGGTTYTYNSTKGVWNSSSSSGGGASVTTDDTAPSSPSDGDLWWDSAGGKMYVYYQDADSSQWVSVSVPGSTGPAGATGADATPTSYTNFAGFPSSGNTLGDFAIAQDTKALYMWDGAEWDRVALGNDETPVILTEPPTTTQALNSDGTTSTVTMTAQDPEGFDVTYGIAYKTAGNALPDQLASATTINQSTGVYTFTPSTTESNAGSFTARLSASDGARITTRLVDFSLVFSTPITFSSAEPGISTDLSNSIVYTASTNTSANSMAQSATLRTGKRYFEIDISSISSNIFIGIADESVTDPGWNISNQVSVYSANGSYYPGGSNTGGITNYVANDVLMIAYDTTTREFWIGKNGTWGLDPASDAGKSIGGTGGFTLIIGALGNGENITASIILVGANLNYSIPTGFSTH